MNFNLEIDRNPPPQKKMFLESRIQTDGRIISLLTPLGSTSFQGAPGLQLSSIAKDKKSCFLSEDRVPHSGNREPNTGNRELNTGNRELNMGNWVSHKYKCV